MFKISRSFKSLDDDDSMFQSFNSLSDKDGNFEQFFKEDVKPNKKILKERFHLDHFSLVQDLSYHFFEIYPDGRITYQEFIFFHIHHKSDNLSFWKHIFRVLVEHTDEMGQFQKHVKKRKTKIVTVKDGLGLKLKEEHVSDIVEEEEPITSKTLNFFQMLNLFLFTQLRNPKEMFRFVLYFLSQPKEESIFQADEKSVDIPVAKMKEEEEEEHEGEDESPIKIEEEDEDEDKSIPSPSNFYPAPEKFPSESITVKAIQNLIDLRKRNIDLESSFSSILELQKMKREVSWTDEKLAKKFIEKLKTQAMAYGNENSNPNVISKEVFKKAFMSMKEFQGFITRCLDDRTPFLHHSLYYDRIKKNQGGPKVVSPQAEGMNSYLEEKTVKLSEEEKKKVSVVNYNDGTPNLKQYVLEEKFMVWVYQRDSFQEKLQYRVVKHPSEFSFYQFAIMKYDEAVRMLFRKYYGRFTFFDQLENPCYYLAFLRRRHVDPSIAFEISVELNFPHKKYYIRRRKKGSSKFQIKFEQMISKLFGNFEGEVKMMLMNQLDKKFETLIHFLEKLTNYNWDYCWLDIGIYSQPAENENEEEKKYFVDVFFDDTKNIREDKTGSKLLKKVKLLHTSLKKKLEKKEEEEEEEEKKT